MLIRAGFAVHHVTICACHNKLPGSTTGRCKQRRDCGAMLPHPTPQHSGFIRTGRDGRSGFRPASPPTSRRHATRFQLCRCLPQSEARHPGKGAFICCHRAAPPRRDAGRCRLVEHRPLLRRPVQRHVPPDPLPELFHVQPVRLQPNPAPTCSVGGRRRPIRWVHTGRSDVGKKPVVPVPEVNRLSAVPPVRLPCDPLQPGLLPDQRASGLRGCFWVPQKP